MNERREKIGEFLIGIGAMTDTQVDDVLRRQKEGDARVFGEIANELGYVDKSAIREYFNLDRTAPQP